MSRELKFRAWAKGSSEPKYIGSEYDESAWGSNYAIIDNKHIVECYVDENYEGDRKEYFEYLEIDCLEQYTGLKDKNGKEIYEGDIVEEEQGGRNVVAFDTEDIGSCGCCVPEFWGSGFRVSISSSPDSCEVIGNIHENPELLRRKKMND